MKKNRTLKITAITIFLILLLVGFLYFTLKQVNNFFNSYSITFNQMVNVQFKEPMTFNKRAILKPVTIIKVIQARPEEIDTDIERYICDVFGDFQCLTAIAIAQAESGLREDAINLNGGNSLDTGIFQINQVHWNKEGCSLKELVDAKKNVLCAKKIFDQQGWTPWVAYNSGNYLGHL